MEYTLQDMIDWHKEQPDAESDYRKGLIKALEELQALEQEKS